MNKAKTKSFIRARLGSFRNAFRGLTDMLRYEYSAWFHAAATIVILALSWWLRIDRESVAFIVIAIVAVWTAEAFNTVLELVVDIVSSGTYSNLAKRAKDIAAAAVLVTSLGAVVVGLLILGPPLYVHLSGLLGF